MFSVVIPLYNKEEFILRAVESVLSQKFINFEIIIIDDGSTDNSLTAIEDILDPRVRIIQQANRGVGSTRNTGIEEAKNNWVAFLDADDAWSKNHLNELHKIINTFPSAGIVSTNYLETHTNLNQSKIDENKPSNIRLIDYFFEASKPNTIVCSSCLAINKKVYQKLGGFSNKKIGEDTEYWAKIALHYTVAISDKVTSYYYRGTYGAMEQADEKNKKQKDDKTLYEIPASVSMLIKEAKRDPNILKKKNIKKFINSKLISEVKASILSKNFNIGRNQAKAALPEASINYIKLKTIQRTPIAFLKKIKAAHTQYKKIK